MSLLDMIERRLSHVRDEDERYRLKNLRSIIGCKYDIDLINGIEVLKLTLDSIELKKVDLTTDDLNEVFT